MHSTMAAKQGQIGAQDIKASEVLDLAICYC